MAADDTQSQQLSALESVFREPDAVMEPNIFDTLCQYVAAQGQPRTAIELLCENYVGYPQMGNLVCDWLAATEGHAQAAEGAPRQAPQTAAAGAADLSASHFLREVVKEDFDPDRFISVFEARDSSQLAWLDELKGDPAGRRLIYQLSASHRSCLVLNFAIQKILRAGYEDEVASVGSSLAGYFGVFHRLMASRLKQVPTAESRDKLQAIASELQDSCCGAEHSCVHALQLLTRLGCHKHGANFKRVAQQLEQYAAAGGCGGSDVWRLQPWLQPSSVSDADAEASALIADFVAATAGVEAQQQRLLRLRELYSGTSPPPVAPLQHPQMLAKLVGILFAARQPAQDTVSLACVVGGFAAAAIDDRPSGGQLDVQDVAATEAALRTGVKLAHDAAAGAKMDTSQQRVAEAVLAVPAAAMGVLGFIGTCIGRQSYWRETYRVLAAPSLLSLLSIIVACHPPMHPQAMETVAAALVAVENSQPEVARLLLDVAASILQAGQVELVLSLVEQQWAHVADPSHVRYFIFKVLEECLPPYSPYFASTIVRLMAASGVRRPRGQRDSAAQQRLLDQFAAGAADARPLQLAPREASFLATLSADC